MNYKRLLMNLRRLIAVLIIFIAAIEGRAQVITAYVGQEFKLDVPSPIYPYLYPMASNWYTDESPNIIELRHDEYDATLKITKAFSGTQIVTCLYTWMNFSKRGAPHASPLLTKKYYIKCSGGGESGSNSGDNNVNENDYLLPESITMGVGQQIDISKYVNAKFVTQWECDPSIAFVSSTLNNQQVTQTVNGNAFLNAVGDGSFILKATDIIDGRTTTCNITVTEPIISLVLWSEDNVLDSFRFKDKPEISFDDNTITINCNSKAIEYSLKDIERLSFIDESIDELSVNDVNETTDISTHTQSKLKVIQQDGQVLVLDGPRNATLTVFTSTGVLIGSKQTDDNGNTTINLSSSGIYILKTDTLTTKILKK